MESQTENLGLYALIVELSRRNRNAKFHIEIQPIILVEGMDPEEVDCPDGYQYIASVGFTNRHNTKSGEYEVFPVRTK